MGKWYYIILVSVLITGILAAGCTSDTSAGPAPATPSLPTLSPGSAEGGQVLGVIGEMSGGGITTKGIPLGTIDFITFTVGLVPGIKSVDMEKTVLIYADAIRTETLTPVNGSRGNPPAGSWGILEVRNEAGSPNNRLEYEERFVIRANPKAPIVPNQVITILVKPKEGPVLSIRRIAPATINEENILSSV
jgi:archaellin